MISRDDLRELLSQKSDSSSPVLSIYLNVDQSQAVNLNRGFEAALKSLIQKSEKKLSGSDKKSFGQDADFASSFIADYQPDGKSIVLFCDASRGFVWQRSLSVPMKNRVQWRTRPFIRPLLEIRDEFERIGVILVDRAKARILTVHQGRILADYSSTAQSDVKKIDASGMDQMLSQPHFQRKADEHARSHLRAVVQIFERTAADQRLDHLVVGGRTEVVAELKTLLPDRWKRSIAGTLSLSADSPDSEIIRESEKLIVSEERRTEDQIISRLITEAAKNHLAVTGLENTLEALQENRIKELVYSEGIHLQGSECIENGELFTGKVKTCPFCNKETKKSEDLLESLIVKVVENGGTVEQARGKSAERFKESHQGIGAFLRF
jgi:peptide chain release factor subunit 1